MADLLAGIEQLAFVRGLKASFVAYPIVNALHIMSIGALLTCVMLMDLRIVGVFRSMPVRTAAWRIDRISSRRAHPAEPT